MGQPLPYMGERQKPSAESHAFGAVLQDVRASRGLTQEALALEVGTERSHVSALERGKKAPTLATILRLATALNMTPGTLVDMVDERLKRRRKR